MGKVLITGGAGFIGCNAASRYLGRGDEVVVIDDLSRRGAASNLEWLREQGDLRFHRTDIRDGAALERIFAAHADATLVLHLAAQVAVTTAVANPREDFEVNATGSFNVLEAARKAQLACPILYSSTNKVYGELEDLPIRESDDGYFFGEQIRGVDEEQYLDFHSPYGCSKGAADQYGARAAGRAFSAHGEFHGRRRTGRAFD